MYVYIDFQRDTPNTSVVHFDHWNQSDARGNANFVVNGGTIVVVMTAYDAACDDKNGNNLRMELKTIQLPN